MSALWRLATACCVGALIAGSPAGASTKAAEDGNPFDGIARAYVVEVDGQVVWQKDARKRLPPASLTKLMTALLAHEQLKPEDKVTVTQAAARETGSTIGLRAGDTLLSKDLLAATLIASANDACRALADHIGGTQSGFVLLMNRRAAQLGLRDTRFSNACGHDAPDHYASAEDLRTLARTVMQAPNLAHLVAQADMQISSAGRSRTFTLRNTNALLGRYAGTVGVKTGTTPEAGKCLVVVVRRAGHTVMLVLLRGKDRWWDATDVLDIAFAHAEAPH